MSPELELVISCSWMPRVNSASFRLPKPGIVESLDWDEIVALVLHHGLIGQFLGMMGKSGGEGIPQGPKARLKSFRAKQMIRALGQVAELSRLGKLLAREGIPCTPLKGVALSQAIYGDPCVRSSLDLDILVLPEYIERTENILVQEGYRHTLRFHSMSERQKRYIIETLHHHDYVNDERGIHVELHWRSFLWQERQVASLWSASIPLTWDDVPLRQLSREDTILFLADHGARHGWHRLQWLSDLAMLLDGLPAETWISLYERALCFDLQRIIRQTAQLLEIFYGIKPPQRLREEAAADAVLQKLTPLVVSQLLSPCAAIAGNAQRFAGFRRMIQLKQLKTATPLSAVLREVLISHADFNELPLPDSLFWLYLPLRPYFWFRRHYTKSRAKLL
jgi:hypothetical protein